MPTISTLAKIYSTIGKYTVTVSGGFDNDYTYYFKNGMLTVKTENSDAVLLTERQAIYYDSVDTLLSADHGITRRNMILRNFQGDNTSGWIFSYISDGTLHYFLYNTLKGWTLLMVENDLALAPQLDMTH